MGFETWRFKFERCYSKDINSYEEALQHFLDDINSEHFTEEDVTEVIK